MRGAIAQPRMHASDAMVTCCGRHRLPASCTCKCKVIRISSTTSVDRRARSWRRCRHDDPSRDRRRPRAYPSRPAPAHIPRRPRRGTHREDGEGSRGQPPTRQEGIRPHRSGPVA